MNKVAVFLCSVWAGMQAASRGPLWAIMGTSGYSVSTGVWDVERSPSDRIGFKMAAVKIYKGSLCMINAAGWLDLCTDTASGNQFAGVAAETVDNSAGSAGDKWIEVWQSGVFTFKHAGAARTDVGVPAYVGLYTADSQQTVLSAADNTTYDMMCGTIVGVSAESSATRVRVKIDGYACFGGAEASVIGGYSA